MERTRVVVIGAGQAGLSAAAGLRRGGLVPDRDLVVLDGEDGPGGAWRHRWPSLRMRTVNGIHDLAGIDSGFESPTADRDRPAREAVPAYFAAIESAWDLRIHRPVRVRAVRSAREGDRTAPLEIVTDRGIRVADHLVNATGTWMRPFVPTFPGTASFGGWSLHAARYPGPEAMAGRRVVVVGGGITAVQLLLEMAPYAASTTWVTRREPLWRETPFDAGAGRAAVALVEERVRAGLPPRSVVGVTGLPVTPPVRAGIDSGVLHRHPLFSRITPDGVTWDDGTFEPADTILWATGWRPALGHLGPLRLRAPGGGIVMGPPLDTGVVADPRVHLVGYGPSASTIGADRAGRAAARAVLDRLPVAA